MIDYRHSNVAVLGSGLTGAIVALKLAQAGKHVILIEQDELAMNRASLRNEGKIHLGLVYAADKSLSTARLMLEGALCFRRLLIEALKGRTNALIISTPFSYLVANDSILTPCELNETYNAIEAMYLDRLRDDPHVDYLGRQPQNIFRSVPLASLCSRFRVDSLLGGFETEEVAIDTDRLAQALRLAISDEPNICLLTSHRVCTVERTFGGFRVEGECPAGTWGHHADQVVNCLWENRLSIDSQLGIDPLRGWVHRLKYRVVARLPSALCGGPSATMVLGRFGDVVVRPDGCGYFSWYPAAMREWSNLLAPPCTWNAPCRGEIGADEAQLLSRQILCAIDAWYPGAADAIPLLVDAGAIVAYGETDVDDPNSGLHNRTRVGITSADGYYTIDPGKLTTAPLFGVRAACQVLATLA